MGQGWRFARAYRGAVRLGTTGAGAIEAVRADVARREASFLASLDRLVWPFAGSPTRRLLTAAGVECGDVRALVDRQGLDGALASLRDAGVYVAYEEYLGHTPARRGSTELSFGPGDFANPVVRADYLSSTSGSRSGGTPATNNYRFLYRQGLARAVQLHAWDMGRAPAALWMPVFPGGGAGQTINLAAAGNPLERWFSQLPVALEGVAWHKQVANRLLAGARVLPGGVFPAPRYAPPEDPSEPLEWAADALRRTGRAFGTGYIGSWCRMALLAAERGIRLEGMVISGGGEPITPGKTEMVERSGARLTNFYAGVPEGMIAVGCPHRPVPEVHVSDHLLAVISRARRTADGEPVDALCWTSLAPDAPRVIVNVENDDVAAVRRDTQACACTMGAVGYRTTLLGIRSISKVVAGGTTIAGEVLAQLAEAELPAAVGGHGADYQFVEREVGGATVVHVRIHPRLGTVDEARALEVVRGALRRHEAGRMALALWDAGLGVERGAPVATRGGKILPFERLAAGAPAGSTRP